MPSAEIIAIGTELLLGETGDTNTRYIARVLRGLGIDLYRTHTVGDNAGRIAQSVCESLARADFVITTGGLGPTVDDPTRQAIAEAAGTELEFHPELWDQIVARISRYERTPTENQKRQAYIPRGASVIENPVGTAPAFIMQIPCDGQSKVVITLPGVPREMETLLNDAVIPYLQKRYELKDIIKIRTLHISGMGEGVIDDQVGDLETLTNPTVGLTAHSGVVDVRIAAKAPTEPEADAMIAKVEADVLSRMGENVFGKDEDTLEGVTLATLSHLGWTLATVEAGVDGSLHRRLDLTGSPAYKGGEVLDSFAGPLAAYAEEACQKTGASTVLALTVSITEQETKAHMFLFTPAGSQERDLAYGGHPRNAARWAVNNALDWVRRMAKDPGAS